MQTQRVTQETKHQLATERAEPDVYDNGGVLPAGISTFVNDTGADIRVDRPRGTVVMSQESFEAMADDMLERITRHSDVVVSNEG